jgi:hypothetical protein
MTITTTLARVDYAGNGVTTVFPVPFVFFGPNELEVIERDQVTGLETTLVLGTHYTLTGGNGSTGTVTATPAPATGKAWTIRRLTLAVQNFDFSRNDAFPAESVERALDRATAIVQEARVLIERSLRVPLSDPDTGLVLPANVQRASRLLAFDSAGAPVALPAADQSATTVVAAGSVTARLLAEHLRAADPRNWGGIGNGTADDTAALQAAANFAATNGLVWFVPEGTWRTTGTVTLPAAALGAEMRGTVLYDGAGGEAALVIGDAIVRAQGRSYRGLSVRRATLASWTNEADIGLLLRNLDACEVAIRRVERFTIGVRTLGSGVSGNPAGFEDTNIFLGRLIDNRYALDVHCSQPGPNAWNNSNRWFGGHFANSSATYPTLSRFGVRFSAAPGAYDLHNAHTFVGPAFELQRQGTPGTVDAIPFLMEVNGRSVRAIGVRMEECSPFVARHTAAMNDCTYEVEFVGTFGFTGCAVDYSGSATRAGGTVLPRHQAAAAMGTPRLVAGALNIRSTAFRWSATETGFEGYAVLSSNPAGPPTTLNGFAFPGLSSIGLNADSVQLPTSRAIGVVVDARECKEFFLGVDGDFMRPVIMQFDASENVLGAGAPVRLSNANVTWIGGAASWWEMVADLDALVGGYPLNQLQRVTLHSSCRYAIVGVRGGNSGNPALNLLRSLRLYTAAQHAPPVLAGGTRRWGTRELVAVSASVDPPSIAAGGTHNFNVTLNDARPGDFVHASFSLATVLPFVAQAQTDAVNVRIWNPTGAAVDLAAGDVFVRAIKPRL